jgi:L-ascorbate metabolism protein UlaG (beta-lactamase superfamily)
MKITYFGHSVLQVETNDKILLFDPFITGNPIAEKITTADSLSPDVIILTHAHFDHWGDTLAIAERTGALVVGNHEITEYAYKQGHENVQPMNTGGSCTFEWGKLTQTYARHSSSFPDGTYGGNPNGYLLFAEGLCVYNSGDTNPFAEMAWIGEDHDIDLAFLPIGDLFTMGIRGALRAARMLKPNLTVPVHFDTYPPIEADTDAWQSSMNASSLATRVLKPGESFDL